MFADQSTRASHDVPPGGRAPLWMIRAQRWSFAVTLFLALVVLAMIWYRVSMDGHRPSLQGRVVLPLEPPLRVEEVLLHFCELVLRPFWCFLTLCVLAVWWFGRKSDVRFEVLILAGYLLSHYGFSLAMEISGIHAASGGYFQEGDPWLWLSLIDAGVGGTLILFGLLRMARDPSRRGAVIGLCALAQILVMSWYIHQVGVAPPWAQPPPLVRGLRLPIASLECDDWDWMERYHDPWREACPEIEVYPRAQKVSYRIGGKDVSVEELERDLRERPETDHDMLDERGFGPGLSRGHSVHLFVHESLRFEEVVPALEACRDAGYLRLSLIARRGPWLYNGRHPTFLTRRDTAESALALKVRAVVINGQLRFRCDGHLAEDPWAAALAAGASERELRNHERLLTLQVDPEVRWQEVVFGLDRVRDERTSCTLDWGDGS